ncbi:MAG: hypothetical protein JSW51_11575 [Gemmatimonadota bacterium]|nr:MAG: hypothetical protein JSW51_11575 [Gemmatimonadota bacterium]
MSHNWLLDFETGIAHSWIPKCGTTSIRAAIGAPEIFQSNEICLRLHSKRVMWVRHPVARLVSAYNHIGFESWESFVDLVLSGEPDDEDIHWCHQAAYLTTRGGIFVPTVVHRFEDIGELWPRYSATTLPRLNAGEYREELPGHRIREILEHYHADCVLWLNGVK